MIFATALFAAQLINIETKIHQQDLQQQLKEKTSSAKELQKLVSKKLKEQVETNTEYWFTFKQRISHFSSAVTPYFDQRYYKKARSANSSYAILYVGGEGPMTFVETDSVKVRLADDLNATLYALEHRGYCVNDTVPLKYVTVDEEIEDLAYFANSVDSTKKWIIIGGSYSGTVVHYAVLKYPYLFHTGWASSPPLDAKEDFFEYDQIVSKSLPVECREKVRLAAIEMDRVQAEDQILFKKWKGLVFPGIPQVNDADFLSYFAEAVSGEVQYNNYGSALLDFLCAPISPQETEPPAATQTEDPSPQEDDDETDDPDWSESDQDSDYDDSDYDSDSSDIDFGTLNKSKKSSPALKKAPAKPMSHRMLQPRSVKYANKRSRQTKVQFDVSAFIYQYIKFVNMTPPPTPNDNSMNKWIYQCCTSFGWWQVAPKENSLRSKLLSVDWSRKTYCEKGYPELLINGKFPKELPRTDNTNDRYAYTEKLPRVVYTNGQNDPWSALSHPLDKIDELVQYGNKCGSFAYKIGKGSHCNDFYPFRTTDSPSKTKARLIVLETLKRLVTTC